MSAMSNSFLSSKETHNEIDSICIGSGRFLRSVLIPALNGAGFKPAIFQTRGKTFLEYCRDYNANNNNKGLLSYEVDTSEYDGTIKTENIKFYAVGTLGSKEGKDAVMDLLSEMKEIKVIGLGLTEAGLSSSSSKSLHDLLDILHKCYELISINKTLKCTNPNNRICIMNTDNVPFNGNKITSLLKEIVEQREGLDVDFITFLNNNVVSLNSMVDRITSQRPSNSMIPKCEPVPVKALVLEDIGYNLPKSLYQKSIKTTYGVVIRNKENELNIDIELKLRVANGTHTALAHTMALSHILTTELLSSNNHTAELLMKYIDSFFYNQILPGCCSINDNKDEIIYVYNDWRKRLCHSSFGLSTFFITQNGTAKAGIRIAPTIRSLIQDSNQDVIFSTAFSLAAILRFFTPSKESPTSTTSDNIFHGWLDDDASFEKQININNDDNDLASSTNVTLYADGMSYNLSKRWYEFKCNCYVQLPGKTESISLSNALHNALYAPNSCKQPKSFETIISSFLTSKDNGGNMKDVMENDFMSFNKLVEAISALYARMICNDGLLDILNETYASDRP